MNTIITVDGITTDYAKVIGIELEKDTSVVQPRSE